MAETTFRSRKAHSVENEHLRVTMLVEGGHLAELVHKGTKVNPLWTPPWPTMEPSAFETSKHGAAYGGDAESRLLAGIMGHNLCMDIFGGPSTEEAAAGMTVHGEASVAMYSITSSAAALTARAVFEKAQLEFERRIHLDGMVAIVEERVRNLAAEDKPTAWTQHVTLGPPFLEKGKTLFRMPATKSRVFEQDFGGESAPYAVGADFDWPHVPLAKGGSLDLRVLPDAAASTGFTTHLMNPRREQAFFLAWSPATKVLCGYVWKQADFPWMGMWEENYARQTPPWNGKSLTRGMEFGVSPMPESRRQMVERGRLFGTPAFRWIPAKSEVTVVYCAFVKTAEAIPEEVKWNGGGEIQF